MTSVDTNTTPRRGRVRAVVTETQTPQPVPNEVRALIRTAYQKNQEKNAATREESAARKQLLAIMLDSNVSRHQIQTEFGDKKLTLEAVVDTPDKEVIDIEKLRTLVGEALFMQIVSATKTAIKDVAGEHVLNQCTKVIKNGGTTAVKVGLVK